MKLAFLIMPLVLLIEKVNSACIIKRMDKTPFNGQAESHTNIDLSEYTGNHNFTLNFLLKYQPTRYTPNVLEKYYIADIDGILKIYMKHYAGVPKLYFQLLADSSVNPTI